MLLAIEKLEKHTRLLEDKRLLKMETMMPMMTMEGQNHDETINHQIPTQIIGKEMTIGDEFAGYDQYLWLQKEVLLPAHKEGLEVFGLYDFGNTGGGHNSGFESLLYIDGIPFQGVDSNHQDVCLESLAGKRVTMTFMLWTGLNGGSSKEKLYHRLKQADVGYLHKKTDEFYYYSKSIYKTIKLLSEETSARQMLISALNNAYLCINWDDDKFYETIPIALESLTTALMKIDKNSPITVHCIGHTHIDVAWLWRLKHTREKAIRSFSTVLRLMEEYDDYVFLQSQPQLYEYIKKDAPDLYEKIKSRVEEGKWEPDGGMWLEADCNIPSGEALVRQLLQGIHFFKDEFGTECEYLWLPDVFGYSWALPQILKQFNINTFATTKISWNQFNGMPHDLFQWRGIDGSEVMTYFINTPEKGAEENSRFATYNGFLSPRTVLGSWRKFKDKELSQDTLISYGYGDGGGGVNRNMLKMRRVMDELPGLPRVKTGKASDFFKKLHQNLEETTEDIPLWDGELYLEYHRGTYTAQAYNKKMNRYLEGHLFETELFSSLSSLFGGDYNRALLQESWRILLRNQFHDIIPGSSIHEVYVDSKAEYEIAQKNNEVVQSSTLKLLVNQEKSKFTLYNFTSFSREESVFISIEEEVQFYDLIGNRLISQKGDKGYYVSVAMLPLSIKTITFKNEPNRIMSSFNIDLANRKIDSRFYILTWNENGFIDRIYDKENDHEVLRHDGCGNILEVFEDKPLNYDNWDIDIFYSKKKEVFQLLEPVRIIENGELQAVLRFAFGYNQSELVQDLILYDKSRRIDFKTVVNWYEDCRLLKTAFEVNIRSPKATYDIQFGHVERPTHFNTSWDYARFEVVGHKWADLSESNYGVSLLNDCKYGYSIKDHIMKLSLLKSTKHPDDQMDMGQHTFTYSLLPHYGSVTEGMTIEESNFLNTPMKIINGKTVIKEESIFSIKDKKGQLNNAVIIDAFKKAEKEDCFILRLHECRGGSANIVINPSFQIKQYVECNLLEQNIGELKYVNDLQCFIKPFEIKSFKIWV